MSRNLVVKHNALINASYRLSLAEQRLILLSIVETRRMGANITPMDKLTVSADIYAKAFNTTRQASYMALREACNNLFNREYGYTEILEKGVRVVRSRWVSEIAYNEQQATVDLIFAPSIVPYITNLEQQFTSYDLEQVAELNSKYSVRLYEIMIAWKSSGKTSQISVEQLRDRLGIADDEYQKMELFKRKVLDKSILEINTKTEINLSYEQHKQGRKIVGFTFKIKSKQKPKKTKDNTKKDPNTQDIFDDLTDQEREIVAQKNAYADEHELSELHRQNLIKQALRQHREAEQRRLEQERAEQEALRAQQELEKAELAKAKRIYHQILADEYLIDDYIIANLKPKNLTGLQRVLYNDGNYRGVFEMEVRKFENLHDFECLILDFL